MLLKLCPWLFQLFLYQIMIFLTFGCICCLIPMLDWKSLSVILWLIVNYLFEPFVLNLFLPFINLSRSLVDQLGCLSTFLIELLLYFLRRLEFVLSGLQFWAIFKLLNNGLLDFFLWGNLFIEKNEVSVLGFFFL